MIQIQSVDSRLSGAGGALARRAAETLILAESMGLLSDTQVVERLDLETLAVLARAAAKHGVAAQAAAVLARPELVADKQALEAVSLLRRALEDSPLPGLELPVLTELFGVDELAGLLNISQPSLRRYLSASRPVPDLVAARAHFLAMVVGYLKGAYNDAGIRRWFQRPRSVLNGRAPRQLLAGDWEPYSTKAEQVFNLARSLSV